jgi:YD repeat-containing protein
MNKSLISKISFFIFFILFSIRLFAQDPPNLSNIIPPSPTAAGLGKYGEIPVSNYTGIPSINIPIYEINARDFKLPISLNYHGGGIRVEDEASWVGLGWNLLAGGVITRSIRGLDDLPTKGGVTGYPFMKLPTSFSGNNYEGSGNSNDYNYALGMLNKYYDGEPDIYYFNFAGYSGKFVLQQKSNPNDPLTVHLLSQEKIKVEVELLSHNQTYKWTITTDDGNVFVFKTEEKTKTYTETFLGVDSNNDPISTFPSLVTSSWYLDEIQLKNGQRIEFKYSEPSQNGSRRSIIKSETKTHYLGNTIIFNPNGINCPPDCGGNPHFFTNSLNIVYDVYLKEIKYDNLSVQFFTSKREDIAPYHDINFLNKDPQKLDKITINRIEGNQSTLLKYFDFETEYFESGYNLGADSKRLKLVSLTEKSPKASNPPYLFSYIKNNHSGTEIPDKSSKAKDHWGFFNGKSNTATQIPSFGFYIDNSPNLTYFHGADRSSDPALSQIGTLSKITYPTGGFSEFVYEQNEFANFDSEVVKKPYSASLVKYGESVINPDGEDNETYTLNLTKKTLVSFFLNSGHYSGPCNAITTDRICASITNASTNIPLALRTGCGISDQVNYVKELEPGTYIITVYATSVFTTFCNVSWTEDTLVPLLSKNGGGIRIKSIINNDNNNPANIVTKNYSYNYDSGKSSGVLMSPLNYGYKDYSYTFRTCFDSPQEYFCYTHIAESSSNIPLASSANGSPIGYSEVSIETVGTNPFDNGKTVYTYLNLGDSYSIYPNLPTTPHLGNGLLTSSVDYIKVGSGELKKIRENTIQYNNELTSQVKIKGMKLYMPNGYSVTPSSYHLYLKSYDNNSEWWQKKSETSTIYDPILESTPITTKQEYIYENPIHKKVTKKIVSNSDESKMITQYLRAADYSLTNNMAIISMKGDAYHHNDVIEETVSIERDNNLRVKESKFVTYGLRDYGPRPIAISTLEIDAPKSDFVSSISNGEPNDSNYQVKQEVKYHPWSGNVIEVLNLNNKYTTYIWGYRFAHPIAIIENAKLDDVEQVLGHAETAFFGDEPNPSMDNVKSFLAPLRTSPLLKEASIRTFSYDQYIGVTSETDPKGQITYYEYDSFQRLKCVKDHNGNILKAYIYNYRDNNL